MALSANADPHTRNDTGKTRDSAVILTGAKIYKGALVVLTAAGLAKPAANDGGTTTFFGKAEEEVDTGDGTLRVEVENDLDVRLTLSATVTVGHTNNTALYAVDDASVGITQTLGPEVGTLAEFEGAADGWVKLRGRVMGK